MRPHKKLNIWNKVMEFINEIYKITAKFPKDELYGVVSQMRRASISIAANIAEGCARKSSREKMQFLMISRGSLSEIDAYLDISVNLHFIDKEEHQRMDDKLEEISRMLQGLIESFKRQT